MVQKVLRREIKQCAAMVETKKNSLRNKLALARNIADQLPEGIVLRAFHEGNIFYKSSSVRRVKGFKLTNSALNLSPEDEIQSSDCDPKVDNCGLEDCNTSLKSISVIRRELPESNLGWPLLRRTSLLTQVDSGRSRARSTSLEIQSSDCDSISDNGSLQDCNVSLKSISVIRRDLPKSKLGWPLLRRTSLLTRVDSRRSRARSMPLVEWVMSLPSRSCETTMENRNNSDFNEFGSRTQSCSSAVQMLESCENQSIEESEADDQSKESTTDSQFDFPQEEEEEKEEDTEKLTKRVEIMLKLKSSCKQFSYKELERATNAFSSENLIGEGGCSNVYRGRLCWGKQIAVKVLKRYEKAWKDFSLEVEIMSSLQHKHITHLIGGCVEDDSLILVYDFMSKGCLEDILEGENDKPVMPWKVRFKVAIAVAEALTYLHNECYPPVIHRDVKSSNILLSDDFQPQLSDFGLAIWGATNSASTMCSDIVGTFGYIAPEYFMDGRVSDKIDIYSFGVVLLELLSGNKPISYTGPKGQESLVKWARPLLESGNLEALLDPKLGEELDIVQMQRMVLAATLCIKQSPRLRPNASQVLELLREDKQVQKWMNNYINYLTESSHEEFNELSTEAGEKLSSDYFFLGSKDDSSSPSRGNTPVRSVEKKQHLMLKDFLKEQQD